MSSVFSQYESEAYPYHYSGSLQFREEVHGGTPTNDNVAKAWLSSKVREDGTPLAGSDEELKRLIKETMEARNIDKEQAIKEIGDLKLLKGFKKDHLGLYLEGRILKSNLKEGAAVALAAGKIPNTRAYGIGKAGIRSFFPEHVFVRDFKLYLKGLDTLDYITEPSWIQQRFVSTWRGTGISYEEVVENAYLDFTIYTDYLFDEKFWAQVWLTASEIGLGSSRSLSYGRYEVTRWELLP